MTFLRITPVLLTTTLLVACGSSSDDSSKGVTYSGNTSPATISASNQQDLALAANLGVAETQRTGSLPSAVIITDNSVIDQANDLAYKTYQLSRLPVAQDISSEICDGGGSASVSNASETGATLTYNNCRMGEITASGTAIVSSDNSGETIRLVYKNFSITVEGETHVLNATLTCTDFGEICSLSTDFQGENGKEYRVSNAEVSGNDNTGYAISATVFDSEHGSIAVTASNITFNCPNGLPGSGSLTFTDGTQTGSVTFDGCSSYTLTVNGVADIINW